MKTEAVCCLLVASLASGLLAADQPAATKTKFTLVKLVDRDDKETYQVLEPPALAALQDEIKVEERLFDRAMAATDKAWRADETTKGKSFPRSAIGRRSCSIINSYTSKESADKALSAAEEKATRAVEAKADAEKRRDENQRKAAGNTNYTQKKKDPKDDAEKKVFEEQARALFISKLGEIKTGKTENKEAEPGAADPGKGKQDPKAGGAGAPMKH
jgi:glucan-binding YG repeat protein